jgi:hypothetical protein
LSDEVEKAIYWLCERYDKEENGFICRSFEKEEFERNENVVKNAYNAWRKGVTGVIPLIGPWILAQYTKLKQEQTRCPNCGYLLCMPYFSPCRADLTAFPCKK